MLFSYPVFETSRSMAQLLLLCLGCADDFAFGIPSKALRVPACFSPPGDPSIVYVSGSSVGGWEGEVGKR